MILPFCVWIGIVLQEELNEEEVYDNSAGSEARKRLKERLKASKAGYSRKPANDVDEEAEHENIMQAAKLAFEGSISCIFEKHLKHYVDEELQEMMTFLGTCIREEYENRWEPAEDTHVLQSANKLFLRIQSSLKRCEKFISKGEPLFLLGKAFQVRPFYVRLQRGD